MSYTDAKVRRNIIVNGVKSVKDLSKDEFKMVPSATLKLELTEKMDKAFRQNKVRKEDKVDKLRESLRGHAKKLIPETQKCIVCGR